MASGTGNRGRSAREDVDDEAAQAEEAAAVPLDPCTVPSAGGGPEGGATRGSGGNEDALKVPILAADREDLRITAAMSNGREIPDGGIARDDKLLER